MDRTGALMLVALAATAIVVLALLWEVSMPWIDRRLDERKARRERRRPADGPAGYDPGRERRAEQRARELLRSCVNEEEWAMYRDLGFLRVWGGQSHPDGPEELRGVDYAYLIYPHKPIVAYLPQTGRLLNEYCVEFPDETRPYGSPRLPDSDDVLAKWMAHQRATSAGSSPRPTCTCPAARSTRARSSATSGASAAGSASASPARCAPRARRARPSPPTADEWPA